MHNPQSNRQGRTSPEETTQRGILGRQAGKKTNRFQLENSLVSVKHGSKTDILSQTELVRLVCHDGKLTDKKIWE